MNINLINCPICGDRFKSMNFYSTSFDAQKTCAGLNHMVTLFLLKKKIDYISVSLVPDYSLFLEVDYRSNLSKIITYKKCIANETILPKLIMLDFPDLNEARRLVEKYVAFT